MGDYCKSSGLVHACLILLYLKTYQWLMGTARLRQFQGRASSNNLPTLGEQQKQSCRWQVPALEVPDSDELEAEDLHPMYGERREQEQEDDEVWPRIEVCVVEWLEGASSDA